MTLISTQKAAEILSVSSATVKRYADSGLLSCVRTGKAGFRKFKEDEVLKYKIDHLSIASNSGEANENQSNNFVAIGNINADSHPKHYLMHKYWGRKAHNVIAHYITTYTKEGETILDPFMGSGVTVIESAKYNRKAVGVDLNPMSMFIVKNSISKIDYEYLERKFNEIFERVSNKYKYLYETLCPNCQTTSYIDCAVWNGDNLVTLRADCPKHGNFRKNVDKFDLEKLENVDTKFVSVEIENDDFIPKEEIPKYVRRNGKNYIRELFSNRALIILSELKKEIFAVRNLRERDVLKFIFTSMLANCSKMLPGDPTKATYKSGWVISKFWVPPIHTERNVFDCFKLRYKAIVSGKKELDVIKEENIQLINIDSTSLPLNSNSVDYIFTDPPYGESIAYFSLSHLWNSWLNVIPDFEKEIILDNYRNKGYQDYYQRIILAYAEMFRVLKPGKYLSFTFHNRDLNVWKAVLDGCIKAGFEFTSAVLQDQAVSSGTQGINKNNTLKGDFVYTFQKTNNNKPLNTITYHDNGEVFIVNCIQKFLMNKGAINSSILFEYLIPEIIRNKAFLDIKGNVINLEGLLERYFDYSQSNGEFKWAIKNNESKRKKEFGVLDLFSGAGGMSNGFKKAGFEIVAAIEHDKQIEETYLYNHPSAKLIIDDIRNVKASPKDKKKSELKSIEEIFVEKNGSCDVIIGGPPCQGFSMAGNRIRKDYKFLEDERNLLFLDYIRMVEYLKPKVFVLENVPGILSYNNGSVKNEIYKLFNKLGYKVSARVLCAADFGVPQLRNRAFFIGTKLDIDPANLFPMPTHTVSNYVTVWEAIGDLPPIKAGEGKEIISNVNLISAFSDFQKIMRQNFKGNLFNHLSSNHSDKTLKILKMLDQGKGMKHLPENLQTKSIHSGSYGRMFKDKPSYTITTRINTPSVGRITHPILDRTITPREAARIQSFDDSFRFFGNITSLGIQIGNAVPPLLAQKVASKIISFLKKYSE